MDNQKTRERILECMEKAGISLPDSLPDYNDDYNIDLNDYIVDSLSFVSFIIAIEEEFETEIPDEMLLKTSLSTIDRFSDMLIHHLNAQK